MLSQIGIEGASQDVCELGGAARGAGAEPILPKHGDRLARRRLVLTEVERLGFPLLLILNAP